MNAYGQKHKQEQLYRSLVTIYLLQEVFGDRSQEWGFYSDQAKEELRFNGIEDPDSLIALFTLKLDLGSKKYGLIRNETRETNETA